MAALEQIVGHPVTRVDGLAHGVTLPPPIPADMQQWVDMARDANYQVVLKRLAVANSQREILKAQAGHYPTLDLVASYGKNSLGAAGAGNFAGNFAGKFAGNFGGNFGGGFGSGANTISPHVPAAAAELGN